MLARMSYQCRPTTMMQASVARSMLLSTLSCWHTTSVSKTFATCPNWPPKPSGTLSCSTARGMRITLLPWSLHTVISSRPTPSRKTHPKSQRRQRPHSCNQLSTLQHLGGLRVSAMVTHNWPSPPPTPQANTATSCSRAPSMSLL